MTIFGTWEWRFLRSTEEILIDKIKKNPVYPFRQETNVFVLEYLKDTLWKGLILLLASVIGIMVYMNFYREDQPNYAGFLVFSMCLSLWLICSGAFRRRLEIDHKNKEYRYYVHKHLWHRAPLHRIYIRMVAQKNERTYGKRQQQLMFKLILNGYKIDARELCGFSEKNELLERQGRRIAKNLHINYFDYMDASKHHHIVHWPETHFGDTSDLTTSRVMNDTRSLVSNHVPGGGCLRAEGGKQPPHHQ